MYLTAKPKKRVNRNKNRYATILVNQVSDKINGSISKVKGAVDKDGHLYVRCTSTNLPVGLKVVKRLGFKFKNCFTWKIPGETASCNVTEHVLFATKGEQDALSEDVKTWIDVNGETTEEDVPIEILELIEKCSPIPRIATFSLNDREDWKVAG